MTDIESLAARIGRLENALMTALVWMSDGHILENKDLCAIDKIIKGE